MTVTLHPSKAIDMLGKSEPMAIGLLPYTSNIDSVTRADGHWAAAVDPEAVRLSIFSRMVADAAAHLATAAAVEDNVTVVAVGEHTFGLDNPSTTDRMYERLKERGVDSNLFATGKPEGANDTTTQLAWLQAWQEKQGNPQTLLIGHGQHFARVRLLSKLFGIPNIFLVDAGSTIQATSKDNNEMINAALLSAHFNENEQYERRVNLLTRIVATAGSTATRQCFQLLSSKRTANVVDAIPTGDYLGYTFQRPTSAKKRVQQLQKQAQQAA